MSFPKKYNSSEKEKELRDFWEKNQIYAFDSNSSKPVFSIDTPPPTVSGRMHIGHAFSYAQTDFIARYKRMNGYEVFYPFGTDDNGLATEKIVQKEKGVDLRKLSREEAVKITMDFLEKNRPQFVQDWRDLGISCDFENLSYSTISPYSQKLSQKSFLQLVDKGLIERRRGPIPWDRMFQTTIAQAELEDKEVESSMNYIKAKLKGTQNTYIIYATTRPEMIFACHGFSVEEDGDYVKLKVDDEYWIFGATTYEEKLEKFGVDFEVVEKLKGKDIIGESVIIPIINREITITHDQSIKADLGTGSAYFCSFGGLEDIEYAKRHKEVEIIDILNKDGTLNEKCGEFEGLIASEKGRVEVANKLKELGVLVYEEKISQVVNVGERSGVPVEYISSEQWFVRYLDRKEEFWEFAQQFNWTPEFMRDRLENWIKGLNWDWGFARQRHFGVPIPAWICNSCGNQVFATEDMLPVDPTRDECPCNQCPQCQGSQFQGESDVFDTWFTSASTPILSTNLVENGQEKLFPMDLRPQAHDIINFWLFYTMAKSNLIYEENPFREVAISGWVLAPDGTKMSKSKGNTIAPQDIVEKYSNDSLRYAASSMKLGYDTPFQEKEVQTGGKVVNKMFNACKFADMLLESFEKKDKQYSYDSLNQIDKWLLSKMSKTIKNTTQAMEKYDYSKAKSEVEGFFMRDLADNYIEIVKQRLWNPQEYGEDTKKAQYALYHGLYASARMFSPFLSYICEEVYQNFFSKYEDDISIHKTQWPIADEKQIDENLENAGDEMVGIIASVRKYKSEANVSMKTPIEKLTIECSEDTKNFVENSINDLKAVTGAKLVEFDSGDIETGFEGLKISINLDYTH